MVCTQRLSANLPPSPDFPQIKNRILGKGLQNLRKRIDFHLFLLDSLCLSLYNQRNKIAGRSRRPAG
jgi:hypothetical protein